MKKMIQAGDGSSGAAGVRGYKCLTRLVLAMLCAAAMVPGMAMGQEEPAANTPIPAEFQASYKIFLDMKAKAHGGTQHTAANMPDWSGIWLRKGKGTFDPNQPGKLEDGKASANLTPKGRAAYQHELAEVAKGNEFDPISNCLPAGYPRLLTGLFQFEFVPTPKETWGLYEQQSEVRRIYTDGRGHIPEDEAYPLWDGDTIGFWDGDTLVAHTIRVRPSEYKRQQPFYSSKTSFIERIRKVDADNMEDDVTVWDPVNLATPWHVVQHFRRNTSPHARVDMWSCSENANVSETATGATHIILPGEPGYRDPNSLTPEQ